MNSSSKTPSEIFRSVVKGVNFFTPERIEFGFVKNGVYELSTGDKFVNEIPYGVTIVAKNEYGSYFHDTARSKCCFSLDEAKKYIDSMR